MEHSNDNDSSGEYTSGKSRPSILVHVVTHSCEDKENCGSSAETCCCSKSENVSKKVVRFKKSVSLTKSKPSTSSKKVLKDGRYVGIILSLFSALQYSLNLLSVKLLEYSPCNLAVFRFSIVALVTLPFLINSVYFSKRKINDGDGTEQAAPNKKIFWPSKKIASFIFLYAVLSVNSTLFLFYGLTCIDIFNTLVIVSSAPIFLSFAAWLYLGERCGVVHVVTAACAILATGIICQPPIITGDVKWNGNLVIGAIYCFTSMILCTFHQVVCTRHLSSVHYTVIQFSVAVYGLLQTCLVAYIYSLLSLPKSVREIGLITAGGLLEVGAQIFVMQASKYQQAGIILTIKAIAEVVLGYTWQALFFQQQPYFIYSIIGAFLMLSCVALALSRNIVMNLAENHKMRRHLWCLLR